MSSHSRIPRWRKGPAGWRGQAALAAVAAVVVAVITGVLVAAGGPSQASRMHAASAALSPSRHVQASQNAGGAGARHAPGTAAPARAAPAGLSRTSCTAVAHIGDSTSVGMVSPLFIPDQQQRLAAQYAAVGVTRTVADASGGRSIVEAMPGQLNGYDAARAIASQGFHGCWVIALGTNDSGNIAGGSTVGELARVQEMMSVANGQPVLWVNVVSTAASGYQEQASLRQWDSTLRQACAQYPNLRIFDWASVADPAWFGPDGIHYTSDGYAARAHAIASALATAYPAGGHSASCVTR